MAMSDRGLALPVSFPFASRSRRISPPTPSTTAPLTPRAYMRTARAHRAREAYPHYPPELVLARWTERGLPLTANIARLSESRGMLRARLRLLRVTMRAVGNHRGARTISFALVAGLAAFEAVLLFGTGAIGIPGVLLVRSADQGGGGAGMPSAAAFVGGESFIAKAPVPAEPAKPTPVELAAAPASTAPTGEARLDGLGDIPLKPWVSEKPKADAVKPEEANRPLEASSSDALPWDAVEPYRPSSDGAASAAADVTAALPARALETPNPASDAGCPAEAERGRGLGEGEGDRDQGRGSGPLAVSFRVLARCAKRREAAARRGRLRVQYARSDAAGASVERGQRPDSASAPAVSPAPTRSPSR